MPLQFIASMRGQSLTMQIHKFSLNKTAAGNVYLRNVETTMCTITYIYCVNRAVYWSYKGWMVEIRTLYVRLWALMVNPTLTPLAGWVWTEIFIYYMCKPYGKVNFIPLTPCGTPCHIYHTGLYPGWEDLLCDPWNHVRRLCLIYVTF